MAADFSEAAIYVGTYAKYNAGSLFGKWFNLSDFADKDEFMEACKELHKDEEDPEFMFQDRENIPEELVSESWISEIFFELRDKVEDLDSTVQEAFSAWLDYDSRDLSKADADDLVKKFTDEYIGQYDEEEDYAREVIEQCYELPDFALNYFDYAAYARDLFNGSYKFLDGFVFYA